MKTKFIYSILQYRHSILTSEAVNIGLLLFFPQNNHLKFIYTDRINKLSSLYPEFNTSLYKNYLKLIEKKSFDLNNDSNFFNNKFILDNDLTGLINDRVLNEDSTTLQFTEFKNSIAQAYNIEQIVDHYNRLYLFSEPKPFIEKHTERYLLNKYDELVKIKSKEIFDHIKQIKILKVNGFKWQFNRLWQNGTLNLVKPISFDLIEEKAIQDKSFQYFGYLNKFGKLATEKNYKFDFLVTGPRNHELKEFYLQALNVLKESSAPTEIITENNLEEYSLKTVNLLTQ